MRGALVALVWVAVAAAAGAQVPVSRDRPYFGVLTIEADATDTAHRVIDVRETLPVRAGRVTLRYPRWIPGNHGPVNQFKWLAGLRITGGGRALAWTRDATDLYALHVDVPTGVTSLELRFQHLAPRRTDAVASYLSDRFADVKWEGLMLVPAGYDVARVDVEATLALPKGWKYASALEVASEATDVVRFRRVSLATLVDSPVFAGRHFKRIPLDPADTARPVNLDVFANDAASLVASDEAIDAHRRLVQQADRLFGARHFAHYDLLLMLGDDFGFGLEHHQSSENSAKPDYFTDWTNSITGRSLLPHEYTHSWNGKFRRPKDLWAPDFDTPSSNSLLWVYEGQTQYWGEVLAARSGMIPLDAMKERIATIAAWQRMAPGRTWRTLQDTTNDEIVAGRTERLDWTSLQRFDDYYDEGALIWLDVDTIIREQSGERRSLDDFARAFFGVDDGKLGPRLYDFDEVVATLERVQRYDWRSYLRTRLDQLGAPPIEGLARAGWRLAWATEPTAYVKAAETYHGEADFLYSLGFDVDKDGKVVDVAWGSPAFEAGMVSGARLLAVALRGYKADLLREEIKAAATRAEPIELLLADGADYRLVRIAYHDGLRYPTLERIDGTPDRLTPILTAR